MCKYVKLKDLVKVTQTANQASMIQIQNIVENSTSGLESMMTTLSLRETYTDGVNFAGKSDNKMKV